MINFNSFLIEQKNLHMSHVEDIIFDEGVKGTRKAIDFLRDLRNMLAGNAQAQMKMSLKYDGCVHEDTVILTDQGPFTIKEIVENADKHGIRYVMGKNLDSSIKYDCMTPMIAFANEGTKNWVEIELENGSTIKLTEDHEVHTTNRGWVKAIDLREEDDITEL